MMAEINVVPLIDVMLVLLIVFMVTAPLLTQGIKVDLPNSDSEPVEDSDEPTLVVSIDSAGNYYVNLGVYEAENPEPVALENLGQMVSQILNQNPGVPVYLEADENVTHGVVINLMSTMEAAGAPNILFVTDPPE
jgi:biopolymer transport protein TolR